jgi:hypothetical protein
VADRADYTKALICFAASGVFMLLAFFLLPTIFFAPQKFTILFTLSLLTFIGGLAYLQGPASYLKKITSDKKNLRASLVLMTSSLLSLYFSLLSSSYIMSLLMCFLMVTPPLLTPFL